MAGVSHDSSQYHVTGSSEFVDDRPMMPGEVHVGLVRSTVPCALIKSIDTSAALQDPDVVAVFLAKDLQQNLWGTIFHDQPLLADQRVNYNGEVVALVVTESREAMLRVQQLVAIDYEEQKPILSIAAAREAKQFIGTVRTISSGDPDLALSRSEHKLKGSIAMAGQDHFYLESQAAIAYPAEGDTIEIHASSQHPTEVQHLAAEALGIPFHQVVCVVKRMGGAFGGKESQSTPFAVYAALVAHRLQRPARVVITKDEDMMITGKRNPFENDYEVGFDGDGRITALKTNLFSDGGAYADLSTAIMERAMLHIDNAYYMPHILITGTVCRTNSASNTAFRGFGGPKGVLTIENIIEDIAVTLGLDSYTVRERNVYQSDTRNVTPYGQQINDNILPSLFSKLKEACDYNQRRGLIKQHNQGGHTTVRGMAATAVKFGISFTTRFLNQGSALVNLHMDGTVQVSTGATEMGQGVNIKIAQVVAETFGIQVQAVRVMPTSTEKNHNTSPTAASSGSDINAGAAQIAALKIRKRLALVADQVLKRSSKLRGRPVAGAGTAAEIIIDEMATEPDFVFNEGKVYPAGKPQLAIQLPDLIEEAYLNRVSLGDYGFFRYEGIHFNKETGKGKPFFYYTNGVACSEVSVDRYTGEMKVLRTDLMMDLGRPINQGIDEGQVRGAFMQGLGWATTENLYYADDGALLSHSPSTYKIPSIHDIPRVFNLSFLEDSPHQKNVRGSKAVGEPPLLLGLSVWAAAKDAVRSARGGGALRLSLPATGEVLLNALFDEAVNDSDFSENS